MYFTHPQFKNFFLKPFLKDFYETGLRNKLAKIFPNYYILFTDSGRSAFRLAVQSLGLENSEMFIPAYICDIFEPILQYYNIKPIYLDINLKTFHVDLSDIESRITPQTKSILICHTYGLPVKMDKILEIAQKHNLKIIEDCAHIFPATIYGDCAFFSFAKLFPVVNGGMLVSRNPIKVDLKKYKFKLTNIIKFLRLFPALANISEKFRPEDKTLSTKDLSVPQKASKRPLKVINECLNDLKEKIKKRIALAKYFQEKLRRIGFEVQKSENNTFIYVSALVPKNLNRDELFNKLRKRHIFCSRIWHNPLFGSLPNTSEAAKRIINFPLQDWFSEKDIDRMAETIKLIFSETE
jgi:dTDP-4-amino-4,6-dideoxygalactose transaminase